MSGAKRIVRRKIVIFLCSGNTCRSPMAEIIFKSKAIESGLKCYVESYGLDTQGGEEINAKAVESLRKIGLMVDNRLSKRLEVEKLDKAKLIVCMTQKQRECLWGYATAKCISEFLGYEVDDPYGKGQDEYDKTAKQLNIAVDEIIKYLLKPKNAGNK
ncbi:MAG: hypothetical protein RR054_00945 [Clostridia bacterium]